MSNCFKVSLRRRTPFEIYSGVGGAGAKANIEALLNSRQLTPMSTDSNDLQPLTPGLFLIRFHFNLISDPNIKAISSNSVSRWQLITLMLQSFWNRWSCDPFSEKIMY